MTGLRDRVQARARDLAVWAWLRAGARRRGIDPAALGRVRESLRIRYGVEPMPDRDPLQRPRHWFPGLASRPWHDPAAFSWTAGLERASDAIREELTGIVGAEAFAPRRRDLALQGAWSSFMLWSFGVPEPDHLARCPRTAELLEALPAGRAAGLTYFSALAPGTRLAPHCGPTNTRLRCHLGLVVPDGCRIRVGATTGGWEEGRCIVFDDSFEHEVWNEGDRHRYVLIVDVWHPDLAPAEVWALSEIERLSRASSRKRPRRASA